MQFPENLLYAESHEWVKQEGNQVTIGITDFAQGQLKDIVYVELPEIGVEIKKGESIGVVESVKTVADLFSPVTGKVVETNAALKNSPQFINEDPYGRGWIVKVEIKDKGELKGLLSSKAYQQSLPSEAS
jgi:glycine cleavage system H protein